MCKSCRWRMSSHISIGPKDWSIGIGMYRCMLNIVMLNVETSQTILLTSSCVSHIGGVMVSVVASSEVNREFKSRSAQTQDYEIGICCFSAKHAALRRKSKDWLARNLNVSEWSDMSTQDCCFSDLAL